MTRLQKLMDRNIKEYIIEHLVDNHGWRPEDAQDYEIEELMDIHQTEHSGCRFFESHAVMEKITTRAFARAFREKYQIDFPMITTEDIVKRINILRKTPRQVSGILDMLIVEEMAQLLRQITEEEDEK